MVRVVAVLVVIGVALYAAIDCLRTPQREVQVLPKPLWLLVIVMIPLLGGVLWILAGRAGTGPTRPPRRPRLIAPDDDPDFLRSLDPPRQPKPGPGDGPETTD
jgi:hypothetical protein